MKKRELENQLIDKLRDLILELGYGFCFIGQVLRGCADPGRDGCVAMRRPPSLEKPMSTANALVQTRIAANVRDRAVEVLDGLGLTVSDVVRIVLTRVANEGALPGGLVADTQAHDVWFRAKVQQALDDPRSAIPHDEVTERFAKRRAAARRGSAEGDGA